MIFLTFMLIATLNALFNKVFPLFFTYSQVLRIRRFCSMFISRCFYWSATIATKQGVFYKSPLRVRVKGFIKNDFFCRNCRNLVFSDNTNTPFG